MYIPPHNQMTDKTAVHALMRAHSFAVLITPGADGLHITHLPSFLDEGEGDLGTLYGHFAKANSHWMALGDGSESQVVFSGPHAYVSPLWYTQPEKRVPTWNYQAVHAHGMATLIEGDAQIETVMARLIGAFEGDTGWTMDRLDTDIRNKQLAGIVPFKLEISRLEAKSKLDQNKPSQDRLSAAQHLANAGHTEIANLMREIKS